MTSARNPILPGFLVLLAAGVVLAAAAKAPKGPELTPADQVTIEKINAADPQANPKKVGNKFCPVTGKPVDPSIPPVDCPQMFQHIHLLVGVATREAADVIAAAHEANKSNKWAIPSIVTAAAENNMQVDFSNPKKPVLKMLALPPELVAPVPAPKDVNMDLTVDGGQKFQTIDGFGTATYAYSKDDHEVYAKSEFQKMVAEDLGMSMVRFEIVPAHFKVIEKPEQISRNDFLFEGKIEGVPVNEKTNKPIYGPTKGVIPCLEFIAALKKLNPEIKVVPSVWSPPYWMKTKVGISGGALRPECYEHYARYLAEWVRFVKEKYGIDLYALSPQNELEFVEPYNSCVYNPEEFAAVVKVIGQTFKKEGLNVKLFGPEDMTHYGPRTVRFIKAVEDDPEAKPFLHILATHGYVDGVQLSGSVKENEGFWSLIREYGKPYWQTETGTGAADDRWNDGGPDGRTESVAKDGSRSLLKGAFSSVGGRLHYAMAYGNASAWLFWQITGSKPNVHSLMVGDRPGKKYYVAKHFYRWIRPGAVRIAAGPDGGDKGLCVTAYQHEKDKTITVVLLNRSNDNVMASITLKGDLPIKAFDAYRTSEKEDCVKTEDVSIKDGKAVLTLPPQSIVTLTTVGR